MADQLDPELMQKLNEKFSELANTINNVNTALGTTTSRGSTSSNTQQKVQRENIDAIEESSKAVRNQNNAVNNSQATFNRLNQQLDNQYKAYQANQQAMADIDAAAAKAHREQNSRLSVASIGLDVLSTAAMGAKNVLDALIDAQIAYTKSLIAGERGLALEAKQQETVGKAINQVVRDFGNLSLSIGGLMVAMGPFGLISRIIGGVAVGLGLFAQYSAKASDSQLEIATMLAQLKDKLFDTFKDLSNAALTSAGGMTTLREQMKKFNFSLAEASQFAGVIKGAGKELTQIGPTTIKGLEKFIDTAADLFDSQLGKELQYMGLDREEQMKGTLKFLSLQSRLGIQQEKDIKKLSQSAGKYISELDQLAALTGVTRQEQEQAREQVMAIEELRAALVEETAKGDAADKERLKILKDTIDVSTILSAEGMKEAGASLARTVAAGGVTRAEDAKLQQTAPQFLQNMMQGVGSITDNLQLFGRETKQTLTTLSSAVKISGDIGKELTAVDYAKFFDFIPKLDKIAELQKQFPEKTLPQILDEMRKVSDPATKAVQDLINDQRKKAIAAEESGKAIPTAADLIKSGADKFSNEVSNFGKYVRKLLGLTDYDVNKPSDVKTTPAQEAAKKEAEIKSAAYNEAQTKLKNIKTEIENKEKELKAKRPSMTIAEMKAMEDDIAKLKKDEVNAQKEVALANREKAKALNQQSKANTVAINKARDAQEAMEYAQGKLEEIQKNRVINERDKEAAEKKIAELVDKRVNAEDRHKRFIDQEIKRQEGIIELTKKKEESLTQQKKIEEDVIKAKKEELDSLKAKPVASATSQEQKEFVNKMYATLLEQAKKQGVANPEVIARLGAAQSALETGYGKSTAGGQNYFGIKAGKGQPSVVSETEEYDAAKGVMVKQQAAFRKYASMEESASDYIKFLKENQRYQEVLKAKTVDEAILAQSKSGFATDPRYGQKLATINQNLGQEPGKMFDGGVVTKPLTTQLRDGGQDEAVVPLNKLADLIPIKSLVDAIERQTAMISQGFENMTDRLSENNSMVSDQLLYMQN